MRGAPFLLVLAACAAAGEAVDITETSGNHLLGELVSENAAGVTVQGTCNGGTWSRAVARDRIAAVTYPDREYAERAALATDAESEAHLARWCLDEGLRDRSVMHARHVLASEPDRVEARLVLAGIGWVPEHEAWLPVEEWLAAHGLAAIAGKVMTLAERDRVAAAQKQLDQDRATAAPLVVAQQGADAAVAHDNARRAEAEDEEAEIAKRVAADAEAAKREDQARQKLAAAEKQAQRQASRRTRNGRFGQISAATARAEAAAKQEEASARGLAADAERDAAALVKRQAALAAQIASADAALTRDRPAQKTAVTAAQPARAQVAASEKALKDLLAGIPGPGGLPPELAIALRAQRP